MNKIGWWCEDCKHYVELNQHGYCAICGNDAIGPPKEVTEMSYGELRAMYPEGTPWP